MPRKVLPYKYSMPDNSLKDREVIIEFHPVGSSVRVSAFDVISMTEIVIQGPVGTPERLLERNALNRLAFVLRKKGILT